MVQDCLIPKLAKRWFGLSMTKTKVGTIIYSMQILLFFTETQYWNEFNTLIDACRRNCPSTSVLIVWESFDFDKIPWETSYYTQSKNRAAVNIGENIPRRKIIWIRNFVAFSRFLKHLFLWKSGVKCDSPDSRDVGGNFEVASQEIRVIHPPPPPIWWLMMLDLNEADQRI